METFDLFSQNTNGELTVIEVTQYILSDIENVLHVNVQGRRDKYDMMITG